MAVCTLEVAPPVNLRQKIVQPRVNQLRHRPSKLAPVKEYRLVIALEKTTFQPNRERRIPDKQRIRIGTNPLAPNFGNAVPNLNRGNSERI